MYIVKYSRVKNCLELDQKSIKKPSIRLLDWHQNDSYVGEALFYAASYLELNFS
jgi:hypothetical protein